jgi:hypothetical protein
MPLGGNYGFAGHTPLDVSSLTNVFSHQSTGREFCISIDSGARLRFGDQNATIQKRSAPKYTNVPASTRYTKTVPPSPGQMHEIAEKRKQRPCC